MYFTSGQDRAFERLMQEKPGFDHYDGGGANAPEDCVNITGTFTPPVRNEETIVPD